MLDCPFGPEKKKKKMVSRISIKCDTCNFLITLRIAIMGNPHPVYTFTCPNCKEEIQYELFIDNKRHSIIDNCKKNCSHSEQEGTIINLMGEAAYNVDSRNDPLFFPMYSFLQNFGQITIISIKQQEQLINNWKNLRTAWALELNNKTIISKEFRNKYNYFFDPDIDNDLDSQIYDFSHFFVNKTRNDAIVKIYESLSNIYKTDSDKLQKFLIFSHQQYTKISRKFLGIYNQYMENYDTFFPIMCFLIKDLPIEETIISSSFNFESIKKFYGDCFEYLAFAYPIIAGINNLIEKREYDQFKEMTMEKYLLIDKANKANCFKDNPLLSFLCVEYDNTIRNSSHHGSFCLNDQQSKILMEYGKPLHSKEIDFSEYNLKCNEIFLEIIEVNIIFLFIHQAYISKYVK